MKKYSFLLTLLTVSFIIGLQAQQVIRKMGKGGGVFNLPEIGGIIMSENNKVFFDMMMPAEARKAEYKSLDIKKGDVVKMMNGKKVSTAKEVEDMYNSTKTADDIKFGLERDGKMFLVSFKKADISQMKGMQTITFNHTGKGENVTAIESLGLLVEGVSGKVKIIQVLPMASDEIKKAGVKEGDILLSINKVKVTSAQSAASQIDKIKTGERFEAAIQSGSSVKTIQVKKEEVQGQFIIKKSK